MDTLTVKPNSIQVEIDEHDDSAWAVHYKGRRVTVGPIEPAPPGDALREALADYAHRAWSGWMEYLFAEAQDLGDQVMIPSLLVERWRRQMSTPYVDLPEGEKESDRAEADKMLDIMRGRTV